MVLVEYRYPSLIAGYSNDLARYADATVKLIIVLVTNAVAFGLFMNYYIISETPSSMNS